MVWFALDSYFVVAWIMLGKLVVFSMVNFCGCVRFFVWRLELGLRLPRFGGGVIVGSAELRVFVV